MLTYTIHMIPEDSAFRELILIKAPLLAPQLPCYPEKESSPGNVRPSCWIRPSIEDSDRMEAGDAMIAGLPRGLMQRDLIEGLRCGASLDALW